MAPRDWISTQLAWASIADPEADEVCARFTLLSGTPSDYIASARAIGRVGRADQMRELAQMTICRAIWSRRQLLERLVDIWSNHFNVASPSDPVWAVRADYDRIVIRANAVGTFRDLLRAVVHHPAMLLYLNNDSSSKGHPNENLGRELLELHTLGVDAGYTEADVLDCARVLTGLSVDRDSGSVIYRRSWHWTGEVSVFGFRATNDSVDGQQMVNDLLDHLARHPATARRVATVLATSFVSDTPSGSLIDRLAGIYLAHDTAIAPVVTELLLSDQFNAAVDAKIRRPAEQLYAAVRALGIRPDAQGTAGPQWLHTQLGLMNNAPYAWATPDGYPTSAEEWRSSAAALTRINAVMLLAQQRPKGFGYQVTSELLPKPLPSTCAALVTALFRRLHGRKASTSDVSTVCAYFGAKPGDPLDGTNPMLLGHLSTVVGLILNAPALMVY
jgi:uncharacterized protein (DUF1800 family)